NDEGSTHTPITPSWVERMTVTLNCGSRDFRVSAASSPALPPPSTITVFIMGQLVLNGAKGGHRTTTAPFSRDAQRSALCERAPLRVAAKQGGYYWTASRHFARWGDCKSARNEGFSQVRVKTAGKGQMGSGNSR